MKNNHKPPDSYFKRSKWYVFCEENHPNKIISNDGHLISKSDYEKRREIRYSSASDEQEECLKQGFLYVFNVEQLKECLEKECSLCPFNNNYCVLELISMLSNNPQSPALKVFGPGRCSPLIEYLLATDFIDFGVPA